jgi:hypothetical protein
MGLTQLSQPPVDARNPSRAALKRLRMDSRIASETSESPDCMRTIIRRDTRVVKNEGGSFFEELSVGITSILGDATRSLGDTTRSLGDATPFLG